MAYETAEALPILQAIDTTDHWNHASTILGVSELAIEVDDTEHPTYKYLLAGDGTLQGTQMPDRRRAPLTFIYGLQDKLSSLSQTGSINAKAIEELQSQMAGVIATAEQAASDASTAATNASHAAVSAESAKTAAATAQGSAEQAQAQAAEAMNEATQAKESAANAAQAALAASQTAANAAESARTSQSAASNAQQAAQNVQNTLATVLPTKEDVANKSNVIDGNADDKQYPTTKAAKNYTDSAIANALSSNFAGIVQYARINSSTSFPASSVDGELAYDFQTNILYTYTAAAGWTGGLPTNPSNGMDIQVVTQFIDGPNIGFSGGGRYNSALQQWQYYKSVEVVLDNLIEFVVEQQDVHAIFRGDVSAKFTLVYNELDKQNAICAGVYDTGKGITNFTPSNSVSQGTEAWLIDHVSSVPADMTSVNWYLHKTREVISTMSVTIKGGATIGNYLKMGSYQDAAVVDLWFPSQLNMRIHYKHLVNGQNTVDLRTISAANFIKFIKDAPYNNNDGTYTHHVSIKTKSPMINIALPAFSSSDPSYDYASNAQNSVAFFAYMNATYPDGDNVLTLPDGTEAEPQAYYMISAEDLSVDLTQAKSYEAVKKQILKHAASASVLDPIEWAADPSDAITHPIYLEDGANWVTEDAQRICQITL
jgi:chemotaxis protein histidine kinase CheA